MRPLIQFFTMFTPSFSKTAVLSLALGILSGSASARPAHHRRDGGDASMSAAFSSMFAAGAKTAAEHADGSTSDNLIIEKFLWSLNNFRYQHDAEPVYWNTTLWEYATNYASRCPSSHSVSRSMPDFGFENSLSFTKALSWGCFLEDEK